MKYEFDGTNGDEIAQALNDSGRAGARPGRPAKAVVNPDHPGPSLSINREYGDGQVAPDLWRIPVGFSIDVTTGEVTDAANRIWDYNDLIEL